MFQLAAIFPMIEIEDNTDRVPWDSAEASIVAQTKNYMSMYENYEASEDEVERLRDRGYLRTISAAEATEKFGTGTMSKLSLLSRRRQTDRSRTESSSTSSEAAATRKPKAQRGSPPEGVRCERHDCGRGRKRS